MLTSSSTLNNHSYSINECIDLMLLANHYMDVTVNLFEKIECNKDEIISFIKNSILPIIANKKHAKKTYQSFYNKTITEKIPQIECAMTQFSGNSQTLTNTPISSATWFSSVQDAFKNGCILDRENLNVLAAHRLMFDDLCMLLKLKSANERVRTDETNKDRKIFSLYESLARYPLITFISDLILLGEIKSAAAIHNFLHLCKRIMLSSNQKVAMTVVKVIAPVLKNGLELHNGLEFDNGLEYANGFDNFENSLSKNDFINQFFEEFTLCCLEDPIFEFPFSEIIDKCFNYPTFKGSYTEIMEKHQFDSTLKLPILPREIIDKYKSNHENSALNTIKTDYVQKLWAPKKIDWSIIPTPKRNKPIRENSTTPNEINKERVQPNLAIAQSTSKPSETKFARTRGNTHNEKMRKFVPQKNDSGIINTEPLSDPYTESSLSSDSITQSDSMEQDVNINEKIIALLGIDYFQECSDMQSKKRRRQTDRKRHRPHSWNNADKTPLAQNNGNNEVKGAVAESNCELKKPSLLNAFQNLRLKRNHETKMHKRGMSNN